MEGSTPRGALVTVAASSVVLAGAPLAVLLASVPEVWAAGAFAGGAVANLVGFMALGSRSRRARAVLAPLAGVLAAAFALILALPPADPDDPVLWLGLPPRTAVAVYGLGLMPMILVPLAYAWVFPRPERRGQGAGG